MAQGCGDFLGPDSLANPDHLGSGVDSCCVRKHWIAKACIHDVAVVDVGVDQGCRAHHQQGNQAYGQALYPRLGESLGNSDSTGNSDSDLHSRQKGNWRTNVQGNDAQELCSVRLVQSVCQEVDTRVNPNTISSLKASANYPVSLIRRTSTITLANSLPSSRFLSPQLLLLCRSDRQDETRRESKTIHAFVDLRCAPLLLPLPGAFMETAQSNLVGTLRRLPLFTDLTESELVLVAERVTVMQFCRGAIIFSEGDPCRELLIVREGKVNLLKTAANGRQQLLSVEPGNTTSGSIVSGLAARKRAREKLSRTVFQKGPSASTQSTRQRLKSKCENCLTHPKGVIPNPVSEGAFVISARVGVRDLAFVVESNRTLAKPRGPSGLPRPLKTARARLRPSG